MNLIDRSSIGTLPSDPELLPINYCLYICGIKEAIQPISANCNGHMLALNHYFRPLSFGLGLWCPSQGDLYPDFESVASVCIQGPPSCWPCVSLMPLFAETFRSPRIHPPTSLHVSTYGTLTAVITFASPSTYSPYFQLLGRILCALLLLVINQLTSPAPTMFISLYSSDWRSLSWAAHCTHAGMC
jgi:hypothetical protein